MTDNNHPIREVKAYSSVEISVRKSSRRWSHDLNTLLEHAEELYGDIAWVGPANGRLKIWGHKAMIYARAPRTLRVERLKVNDQPGFEARVGDRLSNTTSVTDLIFCGSPELLKIYVKWMYTAQGCEVVAEWAARESPSETQELIDIMQDSQSLGEDRLRQDLIYMWRSKLYADVQIHVSAPAGTCRTPPTPLTSPAPSPSAALAIYLPSPESDMTFTAHSFILASRSPYMATEINRIAHPSIPTINLTLPSESFTMAALYFCLGYIYTGSLLFSNRAIDLGTALQIYDSASILGLAELCRELQSRIVYDFCHGLDWDLCHCGRCLAHALELWAHTLHTDMGQLAVCTSTFILSGWAVFWEESQAQTPKRSQRMIILLEDIRVSLEAGILPRISQGFHELLAMVNESDLFQVEEGHDFIPGLTRLQAAKSLCAKALVILAEQELQELDRMRGQSLARRTIESMLGQAISCLLYGQAPVHEALYQRTALTPDSIGSDTSRSQLLRSAVKERSVYTCDISLKGDVDHQAPLSHRSIMPTLSKSSGSTLTYRMESSSLDVQSTAHRTPAIKSEQLTKANASREVQKPKSTPYNPVPRYESAGVALHIPIPCVIFSLNSRTRFKAEVVYFGCVKGLRGPWVGIRRSVLDRHPLQSHKGLVHLSPRLPTAPRVSGLTPQVLLQH